ncbi:MAG: hypothetical protein KY434_07520 [Actinobacteria bacterium]|nr:hypothetical protein [Actinomycetota bacterium]
MADNPLADWLRAGPDTPRRTDPADEDPAPTVGPGDDPPAPDHAWWPEPAEDPPRRRWPLGALAALPWAVVVVVAVTLLRPAPGDGGGDRPRPDEPSDATPGAARVAENPSDAPAPGPAEGGDRELAAAAAVFVRTELTDTDPPGAGAREDRLRYVDLAVPESVSWRAGAAVVTVRAVVLEGRAGRWVDATVVRYAVPMGRVGAVPVPLAEPWAVASDDAARPSRRWRPAAHDPAAARAALRRGGYAGLSALRLHADPALPGVLRARVTAVAPGDDDPQVHDVWLRAGPRHVAVLGAD